MNFVSLFAGIGGIDLGLTRAGLHCVAQVEIDPFARAVLAKHWPDVPRFDDVRHFGRNSIHGPVELICGGFPCQDISVAGKGRELEGERSGLWWEYHRIVGEFRPAWVLAENVPALRSRGADDVLSSLEALGYTAWPVVVGAHAVGAPHKRERVWIVAHAGRGDDQGQPEAQIGEPARRGRAGSRGAGVADAVGEPRRGGMPVAEREAQGRTAADRAGDGNVADAGGAGLEGQGNGAVGAGEEVAVPAGGCDHRWPARPGERQHGWEAPRLVELPVGGAVDGVSARLVRAANRNALRALGNSVVPQIPEMIGRWILAVEAGAGESEVAA